jgi:hypothetical protein
MDRRKYMTPQERQLEDLLALQGVPFRQRIVPATNPNRPGLKLWGGTPNWIIIHETANEAVGANAEMHARFLIDQAGGKDNVSFQFTVDDHEVIQLMPMDEAAWQAGDGYSGEGNRDGLAIERCVNRDGNTAKSIANDAALTRALRQIFALPASAVTQHNRWSSYHKDCPHQMRANNALLWNAFLVEAAKPISGLPVPEPVPLPVPQQSQARFFYETQHSVGGGFLMYFDAHGGIAQMGYPITEETAMQLEDGNTYTVQIFQKAALQWRPDGNPPQAVNIGSMYARCAGLIPA